MEVSIINLEAAAGGYVSSDNYSNYINHYELFSAIIHNNNNDDAFEKVKNLVDPARGGNRAKVHSSAVASAILANKLNIAMYLIDMGADVNFRNYEGQTALHYVCCGQEDDDHNLPMVFFLLERGANILIENRSGYTSLASAVKYGHVGIVAALVKHARNTLNDEAYFDYINYRNHNNGNNALWIGCFNGKILCVKELLKVRADWDIIDNENKTPLDIAKIKDKDECVKAIEVSVVVIGKYPGCLLLLLPHHYSPIPHIHAKFNCSWR